MTARRNKSFHADNLVQGISQQIPEKRTLNHSEDQLNIIPSIFSGNTKRPALRHISNLWSALGDTAAYHKYIRDTVEKYHVIIDQGDLKVYEMETGLEKTVSFPDGKSYLTSVGTAEDTFAFQTLADHTFIANRERSVEMLTDVTAEVSNDGLLYVQQGDYETTYTVELDGVQVAEVITSDTDQTETGTSWIAQALKGQLITSLAGDPYTITGDGSILHISRTDSTDFTMTIKDSIGDTATSILRHSKQRFQDLPIRAPHDYHVHLTGSASNDFDDYYVKFVSDDPTNVDSEGVWVETIATGVPYALNAPTMPHVLKRLSDGTFEFSVATWEDRQVGDTTSNPDPSFVGKKLTGLFFFQNRLGFLAGTSSRTSQTAEHFNFWNTTARSTLDTDPVDLTSPSSTVIEMYYAFDFDEKLFIFGDTGQIVTTGGAKYTPATADMVVTSEYEMDPKSKPIVVGTSVFFTATVGNNLQVMELQATEEGGKTFGSLITDHVPYLIPSGSSQLTGTVTKSTLLLRNPNNPNSLYGYHWAWSQRQQVISSWYLMDFGDRGSQTRILSVTFEGSDVYVISRHEGRVDYGVFTYNNDDRYDDDQRNVHLDYRVDHSQCTLDASVEAIYTKIDLPFPMREPMVVAVDDVAGTLVGLGNSIVSDNTGLVTTVTVLGSYTEFFVGEVPKLSFTFSEVFKKKQGPRGEVITDQSVAVQHRKLTLTVADTGHFEVVVDRPTRPQMRKTFTGLRFDSIPYLLGSTPVASTGFDVALGGPSDELTVIVESETWMPFTLVSAEWQSTLIPKRH